MTIALTEALSTAATEDLFAPFLNAGTSLATLLSGHRDLLTAHAGFGQRLGDLLPLPAAEPRDDPAVLEPITEREAVVLRYLPTLLTTKDIAGELSVSPNTIKPSASDDDKVTVTVYGPPGSLDTSFAGGEVDGADGRVRRLRARDGGAGGRQDRGGRRNYENLGDFAVLRLERDGNVDTSFGDGGVVSTGGRCRRRYRAYAVAVQEDGKIVVAGIERR